MVVSLSTKLIFIYRNTSNKLHGQRIPLSSILYHLFNRFDEALDFLAKRLARVKQHTVEVSPQIAPE